MDVKLNPMPSSLNGLLKFLNRRPLVVASIGGPGDLLKDAKLAARFGADLIEIRVDALLPEKRAQLCPLMPRLKQSVSLPFIATVRGPKEQGAPRGFFRVSEQERVGLYQKIMPFVEMVDLELNGNNAQFLAEEARRLGKKTILSYHNFQTVPSASKLSALVRKFKKLSGDILKIAALPKNELEVGRLMSYSLSLPKINRVFIAMGELGKISRVAGFFFGSCLTYGCVNRPMAPGQIAVRDLVNYHRSFVPRSYSRLRE